MTWILRRWYRLIGKTPADMPMVKYWKHKEAVEAKVTTARDGSTIMIMDGEDQPFPGFPRGHLLFGKLSKLKHEIKNQIFNDAWAMLEAGKDPKEVAEYVLDKPLNNVLAIADEMKWDMIPEKTMSPAVREIHRAWREAVPGFRSQAVNDMLCFILQEDDSYRFRVQFLAQFFNPNRWWMRILGKDAASQIIRAMDWLEIGEVIGDMKERQRLLKRGLKTILENGRMRDAFNRFARECDWDIVKLRESDKYHFRGKFYKVDLDLFEY